MKTHTLDKKDIRILGRLTDNCRVSDRQIGLELGISGSAVDARIRRMEEAGVILGYTTKIEPPVLGYGVFYVVVSGNAREAISLVGEPFFVVPCVGGTTVCGIIVDEGVSDKIEIVKKHVSGVRILSAFEATAGSSVSITKTDIAVIQSLLDDPRKKVDEAACAAGLSTKTVARSIEKMSGDQNVQFTAMFDPRKVSPYVAYAVVAGVSDVRSTKTKLDAKFKQSYMQLPFIAKNQIVLFLYDSGLFEMDDTVDRIRQIDGVESADVFIPKSITYPDSWVKKAIRRARDSPRLHLNPAKSL